MQLRRATEADAPRISDLILSLSHLFTVSPTGEGAELFYASVGEHSTRERIISDNFMYFVAETGPSLAGVVALRDNAHLYHLFVTPEFQGQGLGRRLWEHVRELAQRCGNPGQFTVNASRNAVAVYKQFGFSAVGPEVQQHGVVFVPMSRGRSNNGG